MSYFGYDALTPERIAEVARLARSAYADGGDPGNGWNFVSGTALGFVPGFFGGSFDGNFFQGGVGFFKAPGAAVFRKGDELAISFRGTDTSSAADFAVDFFTYADILGNNNYINAFNSLLTTVASYSATNGITGITVTGHSLGAAAANILRDVSFDRYGGTFAAANYITFATPKVAGNQNILNVGFENDIVYKVASVIDEVASTVDNSIWYDDTYSFPGTPRLSAHDKNNYVAAADRIIESEFFSEMSRDSNVVFIATNNEVTDFVSLSSSHRNDATYYIGRNDAVDDVVAGSGADSIEGFSGSDSLNGGDGNDLIVGGAGDDLIEDNGGSDVSEYQGAFADYDIDFMTDGTVMISDTASSRDGTDTLSDIEFARFSDRTVSLRPGQDIAFVIDTTGSMFDDIDAVRAQSAAILDGVFDPGRGLLNSRVAVVGYNDPETETFLSFTDQPDPDDRKSAAVAAINSIGVGGGGDFPEAVNAGLLRALDGRAGEWREDAVARRIILFGDAPPNDEELAGQVYRLAKNLNVDVAASPATAAVASGLFMTSFSVAATTEESSTRVVPVQIYTVVIGSDSSTASSFGTIASESGGAVFTAADASTVVETLLTVLAAPIYSIAAAEASVAEGDAGTRSVSFTVSRDVGTGAATVSLAALGTAGSEDVADVPSTVSFADGETSKTLTVSVVGDAVIEADETFGLQIVSIDQPSTIGTGSALLTITDDDTLRPLTILDTDESNTLVGDEAGDLVHGFGGDDTISGLGGNDTLFGDAGNDVVDGGADDDAVRGFFGRDTLRGGDGSDLVAGEQDDDWVDGGAGNDTVEGGDGDDVLFGGDGNDSLDGGDGADLGLGGEGDDLLHGFSGRDTLEGGGGNDLLYGDDGDDVVGGGDGADTVTGFFGSDHLFGGAGDDLILGEQDDDALTGGSGADTLEGDVGNDILHGDDGRAALRGDFAGDRLLGGDGDDILYQGDGLDTLTGGAGRDIVEFKFTNPLALINGGIAPGYAEITDFSAADDRMNFDAAGLGVDQAGANFVDHSSGGASTRVDSFYSGAAAGAAGESVMVLTDQTFASAAAATVAVAGEQTGDLILYFNGTVGTGSLLYVRGADDAVSIARFTDVASLSDFAGKGFGQDNFVFV